MFVSSLWQQGYDLAVGGSKIHCKYCALITSDVLDSASEMTYIVSSGALNSTHSLTAAVHVVLSYRVLCLHFCAK